MKLYLIVLVLLTTTVHLNSQEINPLDFFPHNVGDLWQYVTYTQYGSEFTQVEVISVDTILTDSSITITKNNGYQDFYFKIFLNDSLKIYQETLGGWGILYDLDAPISSFWISDPYFPYYTKYVDEYVTEVFGESLLAREYWTEGDTVFNLPLWTDNIALGIGSFFGEFEIGITVLTGSIINGVQYGTIVNVEKQNNQADNMDYNLSNYPNPFNPKTNIKYYIPELSYVTITVYDILGNKVETLVNEEKPAGSYEVEFNGSNLTSGIYIYLLTSGKFTSAKKLMLLK